MAVGPGQTLSHYRLLEKIGEGGMGIVYRARDDKLRRYVALKVLHPHLIGNPERRLRFLREARAAAAVNHPNIATIYEVDEAEGVTFIAMELVEGETLRTLIGATPLPIPAALSIATAIAEGLAQAQKAQVVHRDLKPENVIVGNERQVKILDFGLAKVVEQQQEPDRSEHSQVTTFTEELTREKRLLGTPAYMSPEQARGQTIDFRSDQFSFGSTLYEMVTGRRPFRGSTHTDTLSAIIRDEPIPPSRLNPEVPSELERIISRCLEKAPGERYQDTRDLIVELRKQERETDSRERPRPHPGPPPRRLALRLLGLAVGLLSLVALWEFWPWKERDTRTPSALVGGAPQEASTVPARAQAFYERGLHYLDDFETVRGLDVALQMLHRALEMDPDFALAWATLGEAYWIRYQSTRDDFSRDEAVRAVEEAFRLDPALPEAHNARARGFIAEGDFPAAKEELEKALDAKHEFDRAWSNLGLAHQHLGEYTEGLQALQTAMRLRPDHFRYLINLGLFLDRFSEYDAAASAYQKALNLKPDSRMAWNNLGNASLQMGRPAKAVPAYQRSLEIEENADARTNLGTAHYFLGNYEEAEKNYRRATELEPKKAVYWANLGDALNMLGKKEELRAVYLEAVALARGRVALAPRDPSAHMNLGLYCARAGDKGCALQEGRVAAEMQPQNAEIIFRVGIIFCLAGREDDAFDWLERAVRLGLSKAQIENDPDLRTLDKHPRYRRILKLAS